MEELFKSLLFDRLLGVVFAIVIITSTIFGAVKNRKMENKILKNSIRIAVITATAGILIWITVFGNLSLYSISVAYYEYDNDITEEATGVVDKITRDRECICIYIDGEKYKIPRNKKNPMIDFEKKFDEYIKEGDTINVIYAKRSKFVFEFEMA